MSVSSSPRAPIELRVEYKRLNTFFADYARNISRGGTFIATGRPLPIGTEFVFVLGVPRVEQPLRLGGKVMWVTSSEDASKANPAGMGIELQYPNAQARQSVQNTVEQLMRVELGDRLTTRLLEAS
jgi:type IV pilus assembly protein PilZ